MSAWQRWARFGLLAACAIAVLWMSDLSQIRAGWDVRLLYAIVLVQPFVVAVTALSAFRFVLLAGSPQLSFWTSFKAILIANGLNTLVPARLGELVRLIYLRDRANLSLSIGGGTVVMERAIDVLVLALFALAAFLFFVVEPNAVFVTAAALLVGAAVFRKSLLRQALRAAHLIRWRPVREFVVRAAGHIDERLKHHFILVALATGVAVWTLGLAYITLFLYVAGRPVDPKAGILVLLALTIGGAVPVLPAGLGTYEAAVVVTLRQFDYSFEHALLVALALHAGQVLVSVTGTLLIAAREPTGIRALLRRVREFSQASSGRANS